MAMGPSKELAHLKEHAHQRVNNVPAALDSRDVPGSCPGDCVAIEFAGEVQDTTEELVPVDQWQFLHPGDAAFQKEDLEYTAFCPLQQRQHTFDCMIGRRKRSGEFWTMFRAVCCYRAVWACNNGIQGWTQNE